MTVILWGGLPLKPLYLTGYSLGQTTAIEEVRAASVLQLNFCPSEAWSLATQEGITGLGNIVGTCAGEDRLHAETGESGSQERKQIPK